MKDFWNYVLSNMDVCMVDSRRARAAISSRASHLIPTCDFGRAYSDILTKRGNWVMEDWLHSM